MKVVCALFLLVSSKYFSTEETAKMLYYVYSHYIYVFLWGFAYKTWIEPLVVLQKRVIRTFAESKFIVIPPLIFRRLEMLSL